MFSIYSFYQFIEKHELKNVFIASDDCSFVTKVEDALVNRGKLIIHTTCSTNVSTIQTGFDKHQWLVEKHHDCASVYDVLFAIQVMARR